MKNDRVLRPVKYMTMPRIGNRFSTTIHLMPECFGKVRDINNKNCAGCPFDVECLNALEGK